MPEVFAHTALKNKEVDDQTEWLAAKFIER